MHARTLLTQQAWKSVRLFAPTEVAKAFATSFAPIPGWSEKACQVFLRVQTKNYTILTTYKALAACP